MKHNLLKKIRMLAGISQERLAELIGVHQTYIAKVETGVLKMQPEMAYRLKAVFLSEGITEEDIDSVHEIMKKWGELRGTNNN